MAVWIVGAAVVLNGVLAGVYVGFAVGVMPGLTAGSDAVLVAAMQQINRAIVNPGFLIAFLGAPLTAVAGALLRLSRSGLAGAALAVVTLVITIAVNVPLNDVLDAAPGDPAGLAPARAAFEGPWVRANVWRSASAVLTSVALAAALVGRRPRERSGAGPSAPG